MKPILSILCLALWGVTSHGLAQTQTYTWQFSGRTASTAGFGIPDGSPYSGSFSYVVPQTDLDERPDVGFYRFTSFELHFGSDLISADPLNPANEFYVINRPAGTSGDQLIVSAKGNVSGTVGTLPAVTGFLVGFNDPNTADAFSSDSIPTGLYTRADFQFSNISALGRLSNGVSVSFGGSVDELVVVPEPAVTALLLAGLVLVGRHYLLASGCRRGRLRQAAFGRLASANPRQPVRDASLAQW